MKNISVFFTTIVFLLVNVIYSQEEPQKVSMALLNLEPVGVSEIEALTLTNRLQTYLGQNKKIDLVERGQVEEILKEQGFQQTGACTEDACIAEIGKLIGVQKMIAGSIGKLGPTYTLDLRIINAATGKIEETISENHRGEIDGLLEILPRIAAKVSGGGDVGYDFGQIKAISDPVGAEIYLDGVKIGVTPSTIENIQTGKHKLKISKPGFDPYGTEIVIRKGVTAAVDVKLKPGYFSLKFNSTPTYNSYQKKTDKI